MEIEIFNSALDRYNRMDDTMIPYLNYQVERGNITAEQAADIADQVAFIAEM